MATTQKRRSLTSALIQLRFTNIPSEFEEINKSEGILESKMTVARAQSITTQDTLDYYRVPQIGFATIVEDVPVMMQGSGAMQAVETINQPNLYKLGIRDFVLYLYKCERETIEIAIMSNCEGSSSREVDRLESVKFTSVNRSIQSGGGPVINNATFYYLRSINPDVYLPGTGISGSPFAL